MIKKIILVVLVLVGIGYLGANDLKDAEMQETEYCYMVGIYLKQAKLGVPPDQRDGWPPYDGYCK